jgi:large subunit ribosomal protein L3
LGFGVKKKIKKSLAGHLKNLGNFAYLKEFRLTEEDGKKLKPGDKLTAKVFTSGDIIQVSGVSKGKGFQGVVRRHGFHGSPATHGHKDQLRMPGSIGSGGVQHVFKGTRMGGRMGGQDVTVKNLQVVEINPETNELFIKGAIPGSRNNLILIVAAGDFVIEAEKPKVVTEEKKEAPAVDTKEEIGSDNQEDKKEEKTEK